MKCSCLDVVKIKLMSYTTIISAIIAIDHAMGYLLSFGKTKVMMTNSGSVAKLRRSLLRHEKETLFPYFDNTPDKNITIGIGYNLSARGLPESWVNQQYADDVNYFYNKLCSFPWFKDLNDDRQVVLVDMCWMGWRRFLEFKHMIACLEAHDYVGASREMLESEWAKQVKHRAVDLSDAMLSGVYDI